MNSASPVRAGRNSRKSLLTAAVGALFLGTALTGCDTPEHQLDKQVQADIVAAETAQARGDDAGISQARSALEKAASHSDISPETRATAKSALARVEESIAVGQMQKIDAKSVAVDQLIGQIEELAQQVQDTHSATVAYDKYDPKPAHDVIAADLVAVQGDASKPEWIKDDSTSIPSLAAVTQGISRLQGLIATQHDQQKSLEDRRAQTLSDADAASRSADAAKGQQSVDEYKRASDLRKQAGDLAIQIDKTQADTQPLDAQLKVAQGQQGVLQDAIKELQEQSDALDTGWKALVEALTGQAALAKQIVSASGNASGNTPAPTDATDTHAMLFAAAGASLNEKADALGKLLDQIKQERLQAESTMQNAIQHFNDAAGAAQNVYTAYNEKITDPKNSTRPEMMGWQDLQNLYNPVNYKLDASTAQRRLASMYLTEVFTTVARQRMQLVVAAALSAAALDVPPSLADASLDAEKTNAVAASDKELAAAVETLKNLTSGAAPVAIKNTAKVDQILATYMQTQLARAIGDTATAKTHFDESVAARDTAAGSNLALPPLPADLKSAPAASPASGS